VQKGKLNIADLDLSKSSKKQAPIQTPGDHHQIPVNQPQVPAVAPAPAPITPAPAPIVNQPRGSLTCSHQYNYGTPKHRSAAMMT
jgi:hypothetical protein